MTPTEIQKLINLAEHGKTRDIAIYAGTCSKLDRLQKKILSLQADIRKGVGREGENLNAHARWQHWAQLEEGKLKQKYSGAEDEKEAARQVAMKSVAKVQALEILLKKSLKEDILLKRRRAEQNGQPPDA